MPDISGQLGMRTRNPYFDEEADRERRQADIAREMKPVTDIVDLFLSKRDEMTALCNVMRVSPAYVECVVEAVQEWRHELMRRAG